MTSEGLHMHWEDHIEALRHPDLSSADVLAMFAKTPQNHSQRDDDPADAHDPDDDPADEQVDDDEPLDLHYAILFAAVMFAAAMLAIWIWAH